ncbi:MAG: GlxA family transcriptional regulator [Paracoccaceae bacterium]
MQSWKPSEDISRQVDILLFDAYSALCLANTVEPMRAANGFAGRTIYSWRFLTLDGSPALSSSGMEVRTHGRLSEFSGDLLIAMPSYDYYAHANVSCARALRAADGRYGQLAGFDTGAWLLAHAGLLDQTSATIHWEELERFAETFPDVNAVRVRQVQDRGRITCSGALAAFDAILDMIERDLGTALRLEVAALFMSPEATGDQGAILPRNKTVARAIALMQSHIESPLAIGEIARRTGRSQKDLENRIKTELGATPQAVYRRLRLIQARKLVLETDLGIAEIALRCGYEDPSAMTRAFRSEFAVTPRTLRQQ